MKESMCPSEQIGFTPIGTIRSPFPNVSGMPIQPTGARGVRGTIEISKEYSEGLCDLDGFSHIILIYDFHKCTSCQMTVTPFLDTNPHGIFATRAPCRPNPIGLSVVRLIGVQGRTLIIEDVDILDGTPLLDIKPYVPEFDAFPYASCGWLETTAHGVGSFRSEERFR